MAPDQLQSRLSAYLARHTPESSRQSLGQLLVLTGGFASSLYTFTLQRADLGKTPATTFVLKMYSPDARGREHATREWRALTQLRVVKYDVPRAILCEPDARHLGQPFIVMDYIPGASFWQVYMAADSVTQARLTQSFVAQLVALHDLDPQLLEPAAALVHPSRYVEQELEQLRQDSANSPHAMLAEIVQWLEHGKQAALCERPAILHRDYHPWNVVVDAAEHLWVVDWDWQIGDARFDLAWTCMLLERSDFHAFSSAVRDEYARQSDRSLDDLAYFEVLTTVRWLFNVLPATESDVGSDDTALAAFQAFVLEPVRRAQTFLQQRTGISADIRL